MRDVLVHLEAAGFDMAPRWLGRDEQGRDILSWIDGETYLDRGRMHPYLGESPDRITFDDAQVEAAMRLLRRYHDTFNGQVICHGDYGPWNIVWRDGMPFAIIDFDRVYHGSASDDVAYALRMFLSYAFADLAPAALVGRTRSALAAYGDGVSVSEVPRLLDDELRRAEARCRTHGWNRQLARVEVERGWLDANRAAFGPAA